MSRDASRRSSRARESRGRDRESKGRESKGRHSQPRGCYTIIRRSQKRSYDSNYTKERNSRGRNFGDDINRQIEQERKSRERQEMGLPSKEITFEEGIRRRI